MQEVGLALAAMPSRCAPDNGNGMAASASLTKGASRPDAEMHPKGQGGVKVVLPIFLVPLYLSLSSGVRRGEKD